MKIEKEKYMDLIQKHHFEKEKFQKEKKNMKTIDSDLEVKIKAINEKHGKVHDLFIQNKEIHEALCKEKKEFDKKKNKIRKHPWSDIKWLKKITDMHK